jgi:putative transposase
VKREAVAHLQAAMGLSERRACTIVFADRTTIRYRSRRPPELELREKLRVLAYRRRRFGYRRLFVLLRQEGETSGINPDLPHIPAKTAWFTADPAICAQPLRTRPGSGL